MRSLFLAMIALILCGAEVSALHAQAPNSSKDPYVAKATDWPKASLPVAYGFSFGARPAWASSSSSAEVPLNYYADIFYDAWAIGYHANDYGNAIRLTLRSLGRESAPGWFIEYGNGTSTVDSAYHDTYTGGYDSTKIIKTKYSFVGLGVSYAGGYKGKGITTGFGLSATMGGELGGSGGFYIEPVATFGVRFPISSMALTLELQAFGALINIPSGEEYVSGLGGIGLNARYGFNFNGD